MTSVCVAIDEKYSDNNGAYQIAYFWDGISVSVGGGMYDGAAYSVNCTPEQKQAAIDWMQSNCQLTANWNKYCYRGLGAFTYIGCIVKLARSRKAPNGVDLKVLDFYESRWDGSYKVSEQVKVTDGDNVWIVSSSCIAELVQGIKDLPFWANGE